MDPASALPRHIRSIIAQTVKCEILSGEGVLLTDKFQKPKMRAEILWRKLTTELGRGEITPSLTEGEVELAAAVVVAAFFNPVSVKWDYDRFAESPQKQSSDKFYIQSNLGCIDKPTTLVDMHGKILAWYLPGLLLPQRVAKWNESLSTLKGPLSDLQLNPDASWRSAGFLTPDQVPLFGQGRLVISVGRMSVGHKRLEDAIYPSKTLKIPVVQQWLRTIESWEHLLDAVLQVVHPQMWSANQAATGQLVKDLTFPLSTWPTSFGGMDIIVNRVTPAHRDRGGANTFYDHLLSLGLGHQAKLCFDDLQAEFAYLPGTSLLFTGKVLTHSVPSWSNGERVVIAHYSKDEVHERLRVTKPSLPSQLGWWLIHSTS